MPCQVAERGPPEDRSLARARRRGAVEPAGEARRVAGDVGVGVGEAVERRERRGRAGRSRARSRRPPPRAPARRPDATGTRRRSRPWSRPSARPSRPRRLGSPVGSCGSLDDERRHLVVRVRPVAGRVQVGRELALAVLERRVARRSGPRSRTAARRWQAAGTSGRSERHRRALRRRAAPRRVGGLGELRRVVDRAADRRLRAAERELVAAGRSPAARGTPRRDRPRGRAGGSGSACPRAAAWPCTRGPGPRCPSDARWAGRRSGRRSRRRACGRGRRP